MSRITDVVRSATIYTILVMIT